MSVLSTKWWPANEAFEHDGANRPPVTAEGVTTPGKYLWSYIIWGAHRRIGKFSARFAPSVDLLVIAHGQIDLVEGDGIAVLLLLLGVFAVH